MGGTGLFKMPAKRLLSHYRVDARRNRLLMLACNAEDMLLPRSNFTFYGEPTTALPMPPPDSVCARSSDRPAT